MYPLKRDPPGAPLPHKLAQRFHIRYLAPHSWLPTPRVPVAALICRRRLLLATYWLN
jgi:hypothetical protein